MGNCVGGFRKRKKQRFRKLRHVRLCMLGLDGAGKTTAAKALASENLDSVSPTNGFSLIKFKYNKTDVVMYDLGGDLRIRSIWRNYYPEVFGVIYVLDGAASDRIDENGEVLKDVISDDELARKPLLILLNNNKGKKHVDGCLDEIQLSDRLNLHNIADTYMAQIRVEVCNAGQGTGKLMDKALRDGFDWLLECIDTNYEPIEKRVNEAMKALNKRQQDERIIRQHRLAAATLNSSSNSEEKSVDLGNEQSDSVKGVAGKCLNGSVFGKFGNNTIAPIGNHRDVDLSTLKYPEIFDARPMDVAAPANAETASHQNEAASDADERPIDSAPKLQRSIQMVPITTMRRASLHRPQISIHTDTV